MLHKAVECWILSCFVGLVCSNGRGRQGLAGLVESGEATRDGRRVSVVCQEVAEVIVAGDGGSEWQLKANH